MLHSSPRKAKKKDSNKSNIDQIMWNVKQKQKNVGMVSVFEKNGLFCRFLADFPGKADFLSFY